MARKKSAKTDNTSVNTAAAAAAAAADTVSKEEFDKLQGEYDKLKSEFDTQKDQFLRMAAEYDNYRKRTEKEKLAAFDHAAATIIEAFLPVADNFALALASEVQETDEFRKGIEMIRTKLENAFKQLNVEEFGERGEKFDPNLHDAIARVDDPELGEDYIASVYQKGYKIGDKIIRHAMVQVAN